MKTFLIILLSVFILTCLACKDDDHNEEPCDQIDGCFDFRLTDFEPAWSPDGTTIAYVHGDTLPGATGLYLISADGTDPRILFSSPSAYSPTWSLDSKWIAYSNGGQIYKIKINGDSLTQLTTEGTNFFPSWSPDGQWIAYRRSYAYPESISVMGIWIMNSDGVAPRQLYAGNSGGPSWNPDGNNIYFIRGVANNTGQIIGDSLWVVTAFEVNTSAIAFISGENRYPRCSPNGEKIVFQSQPDGGEINVWIMNANGSNRKQLTKDQGYAPAWSQDGSKIVYTKSSSDNGHLWIMNSDGTGKKQFTFQ